MTRVILLSILWTFALIPSKAQTNTFFRTYNLPGMQGGLGIVSLDDGGFVGIGQHEGNGSAGDCDIYAYRVDECGNLIWLKLFGTASQEGGKNVIQRHNGNLLLMGLYNAEGFLIELDLNGNLIWEKRYDNISWSIAADEDSAGNLYVSGTPRAGGGYVMMGCSPTGNVNWAKYYSGLGNLPASVTALPAGRVLIASTYDVTNGDFALNVIDLNGNIIWSKAYGGTGYADTDHQAWGCKAILDNSQNSTTVISQTLLGGNDNILVGHIDLNTGNPIWGSVIGDAGSDQPRDIVALDDGYAIIGNSSGYNVPAGAQPGITVAMAERDVILLRTDSLGIVRWARTYGGEERDKGIGLRHTQDGAFLISAYTSSPYYGNTDNSMDPLFIRTDSMGMLACQVYSPIVSSQSLTLVGTTVGTATNHTTNSSVPGSILGNFVPTDQYVCLTCVTDPIFEPSDTSVCVGDTVYFFNTTTVGLTCFQRWAVDGTQLDGSLDTISYVFNAPGTYPILLFSNCGANTDTFRVNIRVHPIPEPNFTVTDNCLKDTTRFFNASTISSGSVITWSWEFNDNSTSNDPNPWYIYDTAGEYPVTLTAISDLGCIKSDQDTVTIHPLPRPFFTAQNVCYPDSIVILNRSTGDFPILTHEWSFGDGTSSSLESPIHVYTDQGIYTVTLTTEDVNGCRSFCYRDVEVYPLPTPDFEMKVPSCEFYQAAEFINKSSNFLETFWDFGDGSTSLLRDAKHRFDTSGSYNVRLIVTSEKGCTDSIAATLEIKEGYIFWIPNAFTPNTDGTNDFFKPLYEGVSEFRMEIYNRWGRLVFETNNIEQGWGGNVEGSIAPMDVYVYRIFTTDLCGDKHAYLGRVTLVH